MAVYGLRHFQQYSIYMLIITMKSRPEYSSTIARWTININQSNYDITRSLNRLLGTLIIENETMLKSEHNNTRLIPILKFE